jgi:nicotinamide mononucleotide transporter
MEQLLDTLFNQSATQWIALITGLCYVILAAAEKPACWIFGIISCAFIAYDDFVNFQLYADGVLQIGYVAFGFIGLYSWVFSQKEQGAKLKVSSWLWQRHVLPIALSAGLSVPVAMLLREYTDAAFTYMDTLTTILSFWATWLLVRKVLENWLYWIVIDAVYVILFWQRGGMLIAVLYAIYTVVAMIGYLQWRKSKDEFRVAGYEVRDG